LGTVFHVLGVDIGTERERNFSEVCRESAVQGCNEKNANVKP